jgi:hypothetical protein
MKPAARHGTITGYMNRGCRCDKCRAANAAYCLRRRQTTPEERAEKQAARRRKAEKQRKQRTHQNAKERKPRKLTRKVATTGRQLKDIAARIKVLTAELKRLQADS